MLRIGPGAARAIEAVRLIHIEQTADFLCDGLLAAYGLCHGFQGTPARCGSLVFADAHNFSDTRNVVFAHGAAPLLRRYTPADVLIGQLSGANTTHSNNKIFNLAGRGAIGAAS